jgi:type I restriction enzyme, S subunit
MPKSNSPHQTVRFDEMAVLAKERIDNPAEAGVDHYVGLEHLDKDSLKIMRWGVPTDVNATKLLFKSGDIIFGRRRVYLRKIAVADFDGICSAHAMVLRARPEVTLPEFLPFFMQSDTFMNRALEISVGSLSPTINWKTLAKQTFTLPPLTEQRELVKVLTACESTIGGLSKLHFSLLQVLESLSDTLMNPKASDDSTPLSAFAFINIDKVPVDDASTYKTVGVLNEGKGLFSKDDLDGAKTKYKAMIRLHPNQIVMRKLTAWEGAITVVPKEFAGAIVSTEFPTVSLNESIASPSYMRWVFRQPWFWHEMKARSKGTALRRSRLNPQDLLEIAVNLPPMERQQHIVELLDSLYSQLTAILERRKHLISAKYRLFDDFESGVKGNTHVGVDRKFA